MSLMEQTNMTKLHITTETEEGQILINKTYQIEPNHYPTGLMPEDIQKIIDDSMVEEQKFDERMKEVIDDANRMVHEEVQF